MISVVICTYNPVIEILNQVLDALKLQTFDAKKWELILVDNKSETPVASLIDLSWHPISKVVVEEKQGLAHSRVRGVKEAMFDLIVFIDDDNVAAPDYLSVCNNMANQCENVGVFGGKAIPFYHLHQKPVWMMDNLIGLLGCRDLGDENLISSVNKNNINSYPAFSPIGTGMAIRKTVFEAYHSEIEGDNFRKNLGRKGKSLTSGEDNDIVITALKNGWQVAYFPKLEITHIIPSRRTTSEYLAEMNFAQNKNWVQLLDFHRINPWKKINKYTLPFRKLKAWVAYKAWQNEVSYIKWRGACGMFEGLTLLT